MDVVVGLVLVKIGNKFVLFALRKLVKLRNLLQASSWVYIEFPTPL